jgi:hypothetical protein
VELFLAEVLKSPEQLETLLMPTHQRFGFENHCGLIFYKLPQRRRQGV